MMFYFEKITTETLSNVLEIINSNPDYNRLENGHQCRTEDEIKEEFLNIESDSFLIKNNGVYIAVIDFLHKNPKDGFPWIGLLMIHGKFRSKGYGTRIYHSFEEKLKALKYDAVRLGVLHDNLSAKEFWARQGFEYVLTKPWKSSKVDVMEKKING
jgi:RimJ/RimL family protein N-acetyltransferase